jgi:pimeloyl-ACP methyl ester carboxylesterase
MGLGRCFDAKLSGVSVLTAPRLEGTIGLPDGRRLGFAEFGPATGRAVFWLHGTPGARRQIPEAARVAAIETNVRLIGIDRPGVGDSTPHLYRKLVDWGDDLAAVADALGIDRFALIGLSGGGPYVLASAAALPDRVVAGAVLGGVAPTQGDDAAEGGLVGWAARFGPTVAALRMPLGLFLTGAIWAVRPFGSPALELYARVSPEGDRQMLARPEFKAMFLDDLLGGSRTGIRAPILDFVLFTRPWGFSLADIKQPIRWWHGDADHIVPLAHGQHVVDRLPDAELSIRPGESHLGTLAAAEEILETLLGLWDESMATPAPVAS